MLLKQQYFSYILAVSFIEGWNWRRPQPSHWQALSEFELTTLVLICTDYIESYESNYHTVTTPMVPVYIISLPIILFPSDIIIISVYHAWCHNYILSSTCSIWAYQLHWLDKFSLYTRLSLTEIIAVSDTLSRLTCCPVGSWL